jgi:hypothetical protein
MSNQSSVRPVYSMFNGMDSSPDATSLVVEGFNVDYYNGSIQRRKGRVRIFKPSNIVPSAAFSLIGATLTNVIDVLTDGDNTTGVVNPFQSSVSNCIYLGLPFIPNGLNITMSVPNSSTVIGMVILYFTRTSTLDGQWNSLTTGFSNLTDNTVISGRTLAQSGTVYWNSQLIGASALPFDVGLPYTDYTNGLLTAGQVQQFNPELYWIKLQVLGTINTCTISEIRFTTSGNVGLLAAGTVGSYSCELNSISEFYTRTGERFLVGMEDSPGMFNDTRSTASIEQKIFRYNLNTQEIIPIVIPAAARIRQGTLTKPRFASFNGWLIGATSAGYLWKYNGSESSLLEAIPGMDVVLGIQGSGGYLNQPPKGTQLDIYHNRLMVTGNPSSPMTFWASAPDNDLATIPNYATVGGPNVWPLNGIFNIPGKEGDFIQSASVVSDRYIILTRNQIWAYDETSLRMTNGDIGCLAPGSVQRVDQSIYFLSDNGVFITDGVNSVNISQPINKFVKKYMNFRAASFSAVSVHNKSDNEYWLFIPVNGIPQNQVALIYNYVKQSWRLAGRYYPFMLDGTNSTIQGGNYAVGVSTNATCASVGSDGKIITISSDELGQLFQENTGYDDDGYVFPAYAILKTLAPGEDYEKFREWYVQATTDGVWLECVVLGENESFEQELGRRINGSVIQWKSEFVQKKLTLQNCVDAGTGYTFDGFGLWGSDTHSNRPKKFKFSFGRNQTKIVPVLHWSGGLYGGTVGGPGNYNSSPTGGYGRVDEVQFGITRKPGGR